MDDDTDARVIDEYLRAGIDWDAAFERQDDIAMWERADDEPSTLCPACGSTNGDCGRCGGGGPGLRYRRG